MKTLKKIATLLLLTTVIFGCGDDDDNTPTSTNEFTINGTDYTTPNAYLIFDDSSPYGDAFFLNFLNGDLIEDNVNGISISTNFTEGIVLLVEHGGTVATEQQINIGTANYTLDKDNTIALTNVLGFNDTHVQNGVTYGEPDLNASNVHTIENSGNGTLTINTIVIDYVARTGAVDCNYQFTDDNGVLITGNYSGNFDILNGF